MVLRCPRLSLNQYTMSDLCPKSRTKPLTVCELFEYLDTLSLVFVVQANEIDLQIDILLLCTTVSVLVMVKTFASECVVFYVNKQWRG